jgi:uncharacterized membrane protein
MALERRALAALGFAFLASLAAYPLLPPMPPLWRVHGEWRSVGAPFVAFLLPITAATLWWIFASVSRPRRAAAGAGAATTLFVCAFHVTILIALIGRQFWIGRLLGVMVGLFLMVTGNELPRLRPNAAWGIRTERTLESDELWRRVHRLGGFLRVAMGAAVCGASLADMPGTAELIAIAVGLETIVCISAGALWGSCSKRAA